jgi:hypothetical protein
MHTAVEERCLLCRADVGRRRRNVVVQISAEIKQLLRCARPRKEASAFSTILSAASMLTIPLLSQSSSTARARMSEVTD